MDGSFKRGKNKSSKLENVSKAKTTPASKATEYDEDSVKDLKVYPAEVEQIRFLQRQASQSGLDLKKDKLQAEQEARDKYNYAVTQGEDSLYAKVIPPAGSCMMKLFKKPIFELNGFLKPDLVRKENEKTGGSYYVENRFPYLDCGVIVSENGLTKQFGDIDGCWEGALVSLKPKVRLDSYVYFIDKTEINPTYFEGHVCVPAYEIESVLAIKGDSHYNDMVEKLLGKVGQAQVQAKLLMEEKSKETNGTITETLTETSK